MKEKVNPLCFFRETDLTRPCKNVEKISEIATNNKNQIEFAHKLNLIVSNSINYASGSTTTSTSSKDALRQKGVCQDFAHILISAMRFNQLPARYVNALFKETVYFKSSLTSLFLYLLCLLLALDGLDLQISLLSFTIFSRSSALSIK